MHEQYLALVLPTHAAGCMTSTDLIARAGAVLL